MDIEKITKKNWTPEERVELMKKQEEELDKFMANESKKKSI